VEQLVKRFGDLVAVDGVDLAVPAGTCLGLLGPNGAGKTTTVEILEGLQRATSGTVRVLGRSWDADPDALRARIGGTLQETRFHEKLTVEETLTLFRSFYPHGLTVETALAQVGLEEKRSARVGTLSGGQKQRLALAVGLVGDPELLFLDEPTTGLDPVSARRIDRLIRELSDKLGVTAIVVSHDPPSIFGIADRVAFIYQGIVHVVATPAELRASPDPIVQQFITGQSSGPMETPGF